MIVSQYIQYLMRKNGVLYLAGFVLMLCTLLSMVFMVIPEIKKYQHLKSDISAGHLTAAKVKASEPDQGSYLFKENNFYKILPAYAELGDRLDSIFETASKNELLIDQVEYKLEVYDKSRFNRYHISMPLNGGYLNIRKFTNLIMQNNPSLSLDSLSFGRENTADSFVDANLDFSLYLMADQK